MISINKYRKGLSDLIDRFVWGHGAAGRLLALPVAIIRLLIKLGMEFREGQLTVRSASLVYTTILSLVPFLALTFSVLKAMGVHNQLQPILVDLLEPLGEKGQDIAITIINFVDKINVGVLGAVGLGLLIYSVVSAVQQVESAFNYTWQVTKDRTMFRKFRDYLSVILIGPVLVVSAMGLTGTIMSNTIVVWLESIEPFGTIILLIGKLLPYLLVMLAFTFMYCLLPNTRVRFLSAFVGGVCAGILWQTGGWLFAEFVVSSSNYPAIYSGFAIVLLFMVWVYYNWMILLIGSKISFYHQYSDLLAIRNEQALTDYKLRERTALTIMYLIGHSYYNNLPRWGIGRLVARLKLPVKFLQDILDTLSGQGGLLFQAEDQTYMPGLDMERITVGQILQRVGIASGSAIGSLHSVEAWPDIEALMKGMDDAAYKSIEGMTLKELVVKYSRLPGS